MLTESDRQSRFWHCFKMELNQTAPNPSRVCMYTHARTHARIHGFDTHHMLTKNTKTSERHVENKNCLTANECRPIKKEEEWQRKKIRWNSFSSERDPFSVTCTHCFVSEKKLAGLFLNWQHLNLLFFPFFFISRTQEVTYQSEKQESFCVFMACYVIGLSIPCFEKLECFIL